MPKRAFNRWKKPLQIFNMQRFLHRVFVCLLVANFVFLSSARSQNWDVDFVRSVNPQGTKSLVLRGLSASVYSTSAIVPIATFLYGETKQNKTYKIRAYEQVGSIAVAAIASGGLKAIINRQRPYEKYDGIYPFKVDERGSLPSAHAALAFATATTLSLQYKKWYVVVPAYAWATGCAFSRVYLGEHYPTDVLAGAAIGTGSAFLSQWLTRKIFKSHDTSSAIAE